MIMNDGNCSGVTLNVKEAVRSPWSMHHFGGDGAAGVQATPPADGMPICWLSRPPLPVRARCAEFSGDIVQRIHLACRLRIGLATVPSIRYRPRREDWRGSSTYTCQSVVKTGTAETRAVYLRSWWRDHLRRPMSAMLMMSLTLRLAGLRARHASGAPVRLISPFTARATVETPSIPLRRPGRRWYSWPIMVEPYRHQFARRVLCPE